MLRALERHVPGLLGRKIGIAPEEEERYLGQLAEAGQIRWDGTRWQLHRVLAVDTRLDPERNRRLKAHWAKAGVERLESVGGSAEALFSFNLFAISEASFQKIRQLHLDYYDRVRAIVDESSTADRVVLLNLQLIPLQKER